MTDKTKTAEKQFSPQEIFTGYVAVLQANTEALRKHAEVMSRHAAKLDSVMESIDAAHDVIVDYLETFGEEVEGEEGEEGEEPEKPKLDGNGHDPEKK